MQNLIDKALSKPVESYWISTTQQTNYPSLDQNIKTDILIVGGGITGLTNAFLLRKEGLDVVVIDSSRIAYSTSGHTTAKITSLHGLKYTKLVEQLGPTGAQKYADINENAIKLIEDIINDNKISCDFSRQPSFVYTQEDKYVQKIEDEVKTAESLGLPASFETSLLLPFEIKGAVCFHNQAQFHPRKYLLQLADLFVKNGGHIFENTTALDIHEDRECKTSTRNGFSILSSKVIIASHFPFYDGGGFYSARMYAERSYGLAVKADVKVPRGMYISYEEPIRSVRTHPCGDNGQVLIFSGEHHKTGKDECENDHYKNLIKYAEETYSATEVLNRWSAQDYTVMNEIPYIGPITNKKLNILIATGYQKWGMTTGTVSAMIIKDILTKGYNEAEEVFRPSRYKLIDSAKNFVKENLDVVENLISGKIQHPPKEFQLELGEGKAVTYNGKRAGAYRDMEGNYFIIDTTCKHLGCEVHWNSAEKSWDCPCHASRYSFDGTVLEGPALKPLDRLL